MAAPLPGPTPTTTQTGLSIGPLCYALSKRSRHLKRHPGSSVAPALRGEIEPRAVGTESGPCDLRSAVPGQPHKRRRNTPAVLIGEQHELQIAAAVLGHVDIARRRMDG